MKHKTIKKMGTRYYLTNTNGNHFKYYELKLIDGDDSFIAYWGRIGKAPQGEKTYSVTNFDNLYESKLRKGYVLSEEERFEIEEMVKLKTEEKFDLLYKLVEQNGSYIELQNVIVLRKKWKNVGLTNNELKKLNELYKLYK